MRRFLFIGWLLLACSSVNGQVADPAALFRQGMARYDDQKFAEGIEFFQGTLSNLTETSKLDPALIYYNIGVGEYRQSQPEKAAVAFQAALQSSDIQLQQKAYFNLGNSQFRMAQNKLDQNDPAAALQLFPKASQSFMQAMRLDPTDRDAKINYELAMLHQHQILAMIAEALRRLEQGEQLVEGNKFVEAARWFQQNFPEIDKTLKAKPDEQKKAGTMAERTVEIANIILQSPEFIQPTMPPIDMEEIAP